MINIYHVKKYEQSAPSMGKTSLLTFILLTLVFIACNTYAKSEPSLEISEKFYKKEAILKFNEAAREWDLRSVDKAINLWKEALKVDPTLWIAYLGLGQAYDSQKEYTKSLEAYSKYLEIAPEAAPDRKDVIETVQYLKHILRHGEEAIKSDDYLSIVKTKHEGKELYVRWDLSKPLKIYFYPAEGVPNYRSEFKDAFLEGAMIWQEALSDLRFEPTPLIDQAQIKVIFPSRFKVKGDPKNPIASQIEAQSFPIIRDKKDFRVLGKIMISPYIYFQSQVAIPLEPLSKLEKEEQINRLKLIAAREVGHALGLWGFSPNPNDIMFEGEIKELKLSSRDKNTIKKLYEIDPEVNDVLTNN